MPSAQGTEPPRWTIAIKGGLFAPNLTSWKQQFGTGEDTIFGLTLGVKLIRNLEMGIEGAYFSEEGEGVTTSGRPSGTDLKLKFFPLQAYLLYQLIFYEDQPLVPYLGGGYSRFTYRMTLEGDQTIKGAQEGYHYRSGLALLLDHVDPSAAENAKDWGLVNSYLFLEAQYAEVDDFGDASIDLGGWTYWAGLAYEF